MTAPLKKHYSGVQFSTFIYRVKSKTDKVITYQLLTSEDDVVHFVPLYSEFPYKELELGCSYTVVSCKLRNTWHHLMAFSLKDSKVITDQSLINGLKQEYSIGIKHE